MRIVFLALIFWGITAHTQTNIWDENPNDSQIELDSLLTVLPKSIDKERLTLLNKIAQGYWFINPDKTIEYATLALQLSQEFNDKKQEGFAYINLCQGYLVNDLYDKFIDCS